jgi:ParB family transcriptional regulator, chromosome partitioning protein
MAKLKGLGRGLDALLGSEPPAGESLTQMPLDRLVPGKYQPRTRMDEDALAQLAGSIKKQGIMQPILVREVEADRYEIIAGERRWRAARLAGLTEVPVMVRAIADEAALAMSLIENIQREDLNPLEEAQGIARLVNEFSLTHQEAADAVGRSRSAVTNLLRLLQLAPVVQEWLMQGRLDMGHARALLPLSAADQERLGRLIINRDLSVREAEQLVAREQQGEPQAEPAAKPVPSPQWQALQQTLSARLGARVLVKPKQSGGGRLVIDYVNDQQFQQIIQQLADEYSAAS